MWAMALSRALWARQEPYYYKFYIKKLIKNRGGGKNVGCYLEVFCQCACLVDQRLDHLNLEALFDNKM
jgi:hypothetical protein